MDFSVLRAMETLAREPPKVSPVVLMTADERKHKQAEYNRRYYETHRDRFAERFRRNGANRRYYERNRALKIDQVQFAQFVARLDADLNAGITISLREAEDARTRPRSRSRNATPQAQREDEALLRAPPGTAPKED